MRPGRRSAWIAALMALLLASLAMAAPAAASGPHVKVIASGLDNPRGLTVDSHGRVLVALAGRGGPGGIGTSGKIIRISKGGVSDYRVGLPSAVSPEGEATGPVNVDVGRHGRVFVAVGGGPQVVDPRFDTLMRVSKGGESIKADIQAFRNAHPDLTDHDNPPNPTDSNAYGLAALRNGKTLVTDAAGNELLIVDSHGHVKTVAKFPNELIGTSHLPPFLGVTEPELLAEAVPTSVAVGPDGYWYVGELKGFPFTPGASRIWRISPRARNVVCDPTAKHGPCTLWADGFTSIVGLNFGPRGDLYVVEIVKAGVINLFLGGDATGALWRVRHHHKTEIAEGALTAPGGVVVNKHGTIYVTNFSVSIGGGEVLRIRR
jgi:hypothetical protein